MLYIIFKYHLFYIYGYFNTLMRTNMNEFRKLIADININNLDKPVVDRVSHMMSGII
jgi:hypothetical protein